jgi:hypothetical protein
MSDNPAPNGPPVDLDVVAARHAEQLYRSAVKRGVPKWQAWEEAVAVFGAFHPSWPMPLVEREAARTVGALVLLQRSAEAIRQRELRKPPLDMLVDLATPETPESIRAVMRVEAMGSGAAPVFPGVWKVAASAQLMASRVTLGRLPARLSMPAA